MFRPLWILLLSGCSQVPVVDHKCHQVAQDLYVLNLCETSRACAYSYADAKALIARIAHCAAPPN
jgi:hypothetical protein